MDICDKHNEITHNFYVPLLHNASFKFLHLSATHCSHNHGAQMLYRHKYIYVMKYAVLAVSTFHIVKYIKQEALQMISEVLTQLRTSKYI